MYKEYKIERDELYEKVWSKPMTEIAKEYEVSDKAIAKICDKLSVPVPGLGYWRKIEVGEKIEKQKLLDIPPNFPTYHVITKNEPDYELVISDEAQKMIESENDLANKIIVPQRRGLTHWIIKKTELSLYLSYPTNKMLTSTNAEGIFQISVSPKESKRAFRIMDTLIKELEKRKYLVYISQRMIYVKIFGQEIGISLREGTKKIRLLQDKTFSYRDYDSVPTGELALSIEDLHVDHSIRRNFTDNKSGKLEEKLNQFIIALIVASQALIAEKKYREEQNKIYREKERKRQEIIDQIKNEEKKIIVLNKNIELFHKAKMIRDYIEVYKQKKLVHSLKAEDSEVLAEYIKWVLEQADRLDPLVESPKSILDMKDKFNYFG